MVDLEIVEFREIVDKTALTIFFIKWNTLLKWNFCDFLGFDLVDKIFQLKAYFYYYLIRNYKFTTHFSTFQAKIH